MEQLTNTSYLGFRFQGLVDWVGLLKTKGEEALNLTQLSSLTSCLHDQVTQVLLMVYPDSIMQSSLYGRMRETLNQAFV